MIIKLVNKILLRTYIYSTSFLMVFVALFISSCNSNISNNREKRIEIHVYVDKSNNKVKIIYSLPPTNQDVVYFHFPRKVPGSYTAITNLSIEKLQAFDIKNNLLPVTSGGQNEFIIKDAKKLDRISYSINSSEVSTDNFLSDGVLIENELVAINGGAAFGYIDSFKELSLDVLFTKLPLGFCMSNTFQRTIDSSFVFKFKNYDELIDKPFIFSSLTDSISFMMSDNRISINTHSPNKKVSSNNIARIIKPTVAAIFKELDFIPKEDYKLVYVFIKNINMSIIDFAALEHKTSSIYYIFSEPDFSNYQDSILFASYLKKIVAHELFHLFTPIGFKDNLLKPYSYSDLRMSKNLWLYEGFVEYYSFKVLLTNGIISQKEFFKDMSSKLMPINWTNEKYNLLEASEDIYQKPELVRGFYTRGAIVSFLMDIMIIDKTNGKQDLFDNLKHIYDTKRIIHPDSLINYIVNYSDPSVNEFIKQYFFEVQGSSFDQYFKKAGLSLKETNKSLWYSFFIEKYYYDQFSNSLVLYFQRIPKELQENNVRLIEIEGMPISSFSVGFLFNHPDKPRKLKIKYYENGYKKTTTIEQQMIVSSYLDIQVFDNMNANEKRVFDKLFKKIND